MKRVLYMMGVIMLALIIVSIKPTYGLDESKNFLYQNSNEFFNQLIDENLTSIKQICTLDFCDTLHSTNIEKAVEIYKENYLNFLKNETVEEDALATIMKGFPITKVVWEE